MGLNFKQKNYVVKKTTRPTRSEDSFLVSSWARIAFCWESGKDESDLEKGWIGNFRGGDTEAHK